MKKAVSVMTMFFLCGVTFAQIYTPPNPTSYGHNENRAKALIVQHIPAKAGLSVGTADCSPQIFLNTEDNKVYVYSCATGYIEVGTGASGGGSADTVKIGDGLYLYEKSVYGGLYDTLKARIDSVLMNSTHDSLLVYYTTPRRREAYPVGSGGGGGGWALPGNVVTYGNFIGSTNSASLRFKTNNSEVMIIDSLGNYILKPFPAPDNLYNAGHNFLFGDTHSIENSYYSFIAGQQNRVKNRGNIIAIGNGLVVENFYTVTVGSYNDSTFTGGVTTANPAFAVGAGVGNFSRKNGLNIYFGGRAQLPAYGVGSYTGTPAYNLQVTSNGSIIEGAVSGSSGVTNVATGLGLSGGPITTTGTVALDTANAVVLSRQRAAQTYSSVVAVKNTQITHTGTTTEDSIWGTTIPANSIGPNGSFHITYSFTGNGTAGVKTARIYFNGILVSTTVLATQTWTHAYTILYNRNSLTAQVSGASNSAANSSFGAATGGGASTYTFNTASTINVKVTLQLATGTDTNNLESFQVIAYP